MNNRGATFTRRSFPFALAASTVCLRASHQLATKSLAGEALELPLNPDEVRTLAQQYAEAQANKDPDAIAALFTEDGIYVDTQNAVNGTRRSQDRIGEYFRQVYESYPNLIFSVDAVALHTSSEPPWSMVAGVMWTFNGVHSGSTDIAGLSTNQQVFISGYDQLIIARQQGGEVRIDSVYSYYSGQDFASQDQTTD